MTEDFSVSSYFKSALDADEPAGIAAIQTLMQVLERCSAGTLQELVALLKGSTENIKREVDCSVIGVTSASELFLRFITLAHTQLEQKDFDFCRKLMLQRGRQFLAKLGEARTKISLLVEPFIQDGSRILVHSASRVVMEALNRAADNNKEFHVYVSGESQLAAKNLAARGIQVTEVRDSAVGYVMHKVDCLLLGAEGVAESGGVVNQLGSYTAAIVARAINKPVYVLAESFKFVRFYPLGQDDLPNEYKYPASVLRRGGDLEVEHPMVDYTPPHLLSLLFTDLGILTPSAVSDELINLYL